MAEKKYLDSSGLIRLVANLINKFPTKTEIDAKVAELQSSIDSIDDAVDNIESGTIIVKEAEHAVSADNATNAANAVNANHATTADNATNAANATNANHAVTADSAINATNATNAENAENAERADYADEAGNANYATSAGSAASATKAMQDGNGNVISETYQTIADATLQHNALQSSINDNVDALNDAIDLKADITDFNESIIGLSVSGTTVTYIKGDGSVHTFETQDTDTTYSLGTDEVTGLTKLYATTGSAEDGTMTQKAIKTELDKKVGVSIDDSNNVLVFTK